MEQEVMNLIAELLKLDTDSLSSRFNQTTIWDSLQRVEILFAIEDEFDVQFSEAELARLDTPEKLYKAVLRKVR